jgi:diguanylate cyclase (GGDEF)-like protein
MSELAHALSSSPLSAVEETTAFDLAPVSLWLEDYAGLKTLFEAWRAEGVVDLRSFLAADIARIETCTRMIRVVRVNRKTLELYEARDAIHLFAGLDSVFRGDMLINHVDELVQLWEGRTEFASQTVNYTLGGRRMDILLHARVLPGCEDDWSRVLVAIEDVSEREAARRELAHAEAHARGLFQHSPVSLWVEDFSSIKALLDEVRACGIQDFRTFTDVHPEFVVRCMAEIRVIDVNRKTLDIFRAADRTELLLRQHEIFRGSMQAPFREQLIDLWNGVLFQQREVINHSLAGEELHFLMQFSVLPGHEARWDLVQIALTDITARKKAEAYLEFLGKHDSLTKLYNRAFYVEEIARLERGDLSPTTIVVVDLNGLKDTNDRFGHAAGDQLLRRAGEVLGKIAEEPARAARIGGDEFAILLPATDERGGAAFVERIHRLADLNNQYYVGRLLSFAIGAATSQPGERLEATARRADAAMYAAKRLHYASLDPLE